MLYRLLVFFLISLQFFFPASMQTDFACSPEQILQIEQNYEELDLPVRGIATILDPQRTTRLLLTIVFEDHRKIRDEFIPNLPDCREAKLLAVILSVSLEMGLSRLALEALWEYVALYGENDILDKIENILKRPYAFLTPAADQSLPVLNALASQLIIPLCSTENRGLEGYQNMLKTYETLYPAFVNFMATGSGNFDELFVSETLAREGYINLANACEEEFLGSVDILSNHRINDLS